MSGGGEAYAREKKNRPRHHPRHDLHDAETDVDDPGPLGEYLRLCRDHLSEPFGHADREALASQRQHRRVTGAGAALGGAALVLAAVNISFHGLIPTWLLLVEAGLAALATVFVLAGLVRRWHGEWLLRRYQAEQFRLVKFRFLVDPDFWCEGGPSAVRTRDRFIHEVARIQAIEEGELDALAADEDVPKLPSEAACAAISDALRLEILAYYRRQRLESQIRYFSTAGRKRARLYQSPALLPLIFFASVLAIVVHAWAERQERVEGTKRTPSRPELRAAAPDGGRPEGARRHEAAPRSSSEPVEMLGRVALALSLGLPGAWAGIRTWKTANEFGRNHARSLARFRSLSKIADRLSPHAAAEDVFADLGLAEHVLATDQGEWLRLMREAEWYG